MRQRIACNRLFARHDRRSRASSDAEATPARGARWLYFLLLLTTSVGAVIFLTQTGVAGPVAYRDAAAIFGSAIVSSVAGFAFSAICGAFLFRGGGTPQQVVHIIVLSSLAIQSLGIVALWRSIDWPSLRAFLRGGALGLPIGVFLLYHVPTSTYLHAMGTFLLIYGTYMLFGRPIVVTVGPRTGAAIDTIAGVLGGITGGFAGFPGCFVTIWCSQRGWDKLRQRAVLAPFIFIMQAATIAVLSACAPLTRENGPPLDVAALAYVPAALSGAYLGMLVFRRLSDRQFGRFVALMLVACGIALTVPR